MKLKVGNWYKCADPDECAEAGNKPYDKIVGFDLVKKKFVGKDGDLYSANGNYNNRNNIFRCLDLVELMQNPPE